jgi:hypothetical protein
MTCADLRDRFSARLDEALAVEERAAFDAHLATCADCRREWRRFAMTVGLVRGIEPARAPADFVDRVLTAVRPRPWYRRLLRDLFVPWPVKLPLEAAAVVLVAGLAIVIFQRSPELQRAARPAELQQKTRAFEPPTPAPMSSTPSAVPSAPPPTERRESGGRRPVSPPSPDVGPRVLDRLATNDQAPPARPAERDVVAPSPPPAASEPRAQSEDARQNVVSAPPKAGTAVEPQPAAPGSALRSRVEQKAAPSQSYAPGLIATRIRPPVEARLAVSDRAAAEREIAALLARLGGTGMPRAAASGVLEFLVPRDAYSTLTSELAKLGQLRIDGEPAGDADAVHVRLRFAE